MYPRGLAFGLGIRADLAVNDIARGSSNEKRNSTKVTIISTPDTYLNSLIEASPNLVAVASNDGRLLSINAAGRALLGLRPSTDITALVMTDLFPADDLSFAREVIFAEVERKTRWTGPLRLQRRDSLATVPADITVYHVHATSGTGRAPAFALIAMDSTERRRNDLRTRALLDAGSTLIDMSDAQRTFVDLAELIVRTMATTCVIDLFGDGPGGTRTVERVASYHIDRAWRGLIGKIVATAPENTNPQHPVRRLLVDGASTIVTNIDDSWIDDHATSEDHAMMIRTMRLRSSMTVPLVAAGEIVGALTCALGDEHVVRTGLPAAYDAEDLFFLEELGRRAGRSIETARLYERERRIAQTLQAASLPTSLPSHDGLHIDAEYRPGNAEATIGGDWYDAFTLADGRIVLTVGDVLGNGLHAAVTMTKLRQAMQAAAMVSASPNVMLDVADRTLRLHDSDGYATAIAAIYDPASYVTSIASAGHPGPTRRLKSGSVDEFSSPGLLLGMRDGNDTNVIEIATPPGSMLVFFTDGLTEATRDADEGMLRVRQALEEATVIAGERPARAIVEHVLRGSDAGDDIAVLTLQIR